jgi:hypothetical protein
MASFHQFIPIGQLGPCLEISLYSVLCTCLYKGQLRQYQETVLYCVTCVLCA